MTTLKVETMRTDGDRKVANFPNRSQIMTIDVHLELELAVFRLNYIFPCPVCISKKLSNFLTKRKHTECWPECWPVFPIHAQLIWCVYYKLFTEKSISASIIIY
jgi:hypothetical protein